MPARLTSRSDVLLAYRTYSKTTSKRGYLSYSYGSKISAGHSSIQQDGSETSL